ncbi:uncharacterized protein CBL_07975 [Carabus blaptoides fortunei]
MTELRELIISSNELYLLPIGLFRDTWNLQQIDFSKNEIRTIQSGLFRNLTKMTVLKLAINHIADIGMSAFWDMPDLKSIDLSQNRITYLDGYTFVNNEKLVDINLYENALTFLGEGLFARQYAVEILNIGQNRITSLTKYTFTNMHKLRKLLAAQNEIKEVAKGAFDNNTQLASVELHRNQIVDLESGLFVNAKNLDKLDLGINEISHIGDDVFPQSLSTLKLSGNRLQYMNVKTISRLPRLFLLVLYNNPWRCNCHLIELYKVGLQFEDPYSKTRCAEPEQLKNKKWEELDVSNFKCTGNEPIPSAPEKLISNVTNTTATIIYTSAMNIVKRKQLIVNVGDTAAFLVNIFGHPWLLDQWYLRGQNITENMKSASGNFYKRMNFASQTQDDYTHFRLTITNVKPEDGGEYICHVQNLWQDIVTVERFTLVVYTSQEQFNSSTLIWSLFITVIVLYILVVAIKFHMRRYRGNDKYDKPVIFQSIMKEFGRFKKEANSQSPVLLKNTEDTDSIICIEPIEIMPTTAVDSEETDNSIIAEVTTETKEEKEDPEQQVEPAIIDISITENKPDTEDKIDE